MLEEKQGIFNTNFWSWMLLILMVVICIPLGLQIAPADVTKVDEGAHFGQIQAFLAGRIGTPAELGLTMLPGYHTAIALLAKLFNVDSLFNVRAVGLLLSIPSVFIFAFIARKIGDINPPQLALVYFLCPLFFPYFFLIYTDITSITLVTLGVLLTLYNRFHTAALALFLSMLVRQDNVVWALLCFMLALHQFEHFSFSAIFTSKAANALKLIATRLWIFFLVFIAFMLFVKVNGGVAIGDPESHKLGRVYTTQIYLCLLTLFVLLLPLHLANAKDIATLLTRQPIWIFVGACSFPVFILTFWTDHGYNNFGGFIHNEVVFWLRASLLNKVVAYMGIIWCFYSLLVTRLAENRFYWLYPLSAVAVVPHALIEARYFMIPIVLFLAFRKRENDKLDYLTLSIYVIASWYLGTAVRTGTIFM